MTEQFNEQKYHDIQNPDSKAGAGLEVAKTTELAKVLSNVAELEESIQKDQMVSATQVQELRGQLEGVKIDFYGQRLSLAEVKAIPDLKQNLKIFEEIKTGNLENARNLTYISPDITQLIMDEGWDSPWFRLKALPVESAKIASEHELQGKTENYTLLFGDLEVLSDEAAKYLGNSKLGLSFFGQTKISPQGYSYLTENKGSLYFEQLPEISDELISSLANYHGEELTLGGRVELTNQQVRILADSSVPYLSFACFSDLSDSLAESLSHFHGKLGFERLERLSDHAAEVLSQSPTITEIVFKTSVELSGRARKLLFKKAKYSTEVV